MKVDVINRMKLDRKDDSEIIRILILEDVQLDVELIRIELKKELDFVDEVIYKKEDFIPTIQSFNPHVILSDYSMPQFTGLEALEIMRNNDLHIPFIIVTGAIDEETAVSCIKAGANDYLLKDRLARLPEAIKHSILQDRIEKEKNEGLIALKESNRKFVALGKTIPDYVFLINREGVIKYANHSMIFAKKYKEESNIYKYLPTPFHEIIQKALKSRHWEGVGKTLNLSYQDDEGRRFFYRCRIQDTLKGGGSKEFMLMLSDISDIEEAKIELEMTHSRLRELLNKLELVRDDEKKRISLEIHDQLGQELTANKLGLFYLKQHLELLDSKDKNVELSVNKVNEMISLSAETIKTVRRIAHQLRPIILDDLGLIPAVEWLVKKYNENGEIHWEFNVEIDEIDLQANFSTVLFRIVQETMTNVVRHAQAKNCKISLVKQSDTFYLLVEDDGVGIDLDIDMNERLGLFGIKERIKPWNGTMAILESSMEGTLIMVHFPIEKILNDD